MNANELADELKLVRCLAGDGQVLDKAATMLHQQQAEIEVLKDWQDIWRPFLKKHFGIES